ncbi:MAG: TetR/AcrR family transcriptional regulator [Deltaproteobacteria bacterium]|nr:MAG: TetR/AcrR family transcriptional regulator [Deltaproteobacteria bacterium]
MEAKRTFFNLPEEKREKIIKAALEEFASKGWKGASVNSIVARAGIAKGSLYQYFRDKRSLFLFLFDKAVGVAKETLKRVKRQTAEKPLRERLRESLLAGVDFIERHPLLYRIYLQLVFERDVPFRQDLIGRLRVLSFDYILSLLEEALKRGEVREGLDLKAAAFLIDAVMERFLQLQAFPHLAPGWSPKGREEVEQRVEELVDLIEKGVRP